MAVAQKVITRNEVPKQATWNHESIFADRDAWYAALEAFMADLNELNAYPGTLTTPERIVECMEVISQFRRRISKLYFYAGMSGAVDANDEEAKAMSGQASGAMGKLMARNAFVRPELLALGADTLRGWLDQSADFAVHRHTIEDMLRQQAHTRSPEIEQILGMLSDPFSAMSDVAGELANTDLKFADATDSNGDNYRVMQSTNDSLRQSNDRTLRRSAWENYADSYLSMKNTLAAAYIGSVKQNVFQANVRGYDNVLQSRLAPFNIPREVFDNLIATFKANLPTWHRYWAVKARAIDVEKMQPWDIWAPLTPAAPAVSFEQSVDWIAEGMQPLGADYVEALRRGCLEERWVDYYPNEGKRQGAFSGGAYDTYPFIMMSYDNSIGDLSTLAHELGHSLHSYLSRKHQPEYYARYSMFAAEVASNFNQAMTRAYLLDKQSERDFQLALIDEAMTNFHRYFFIMPTLARFELEVHSRAEQGKPLNASILNGIMADLYAEGYGDTLADDSTRTGITWAQFQHLYVPFYTFQYATGISAAHALAEKVQAGTEDDAENYRKFLRAGGSMYPIDALAVAGVDMSTPEAVEKTFGVLGSLVDRLEALL
jgi:oligoendopeptidase F